jgi:hypothetical protein
MCDVLNISKGNPNQVQRLPTSSSGSVSIYRSQAITDSQTAGHLSGQLA